MPEIWLPIRGYEGRYEVSNDGRVRSLNRLIYDPRSKTTNRPEYRNYPGKILVPIKIKSGYLRVKLGGKHNGISIHKLVAEAFLGPCPKDKQVCHNDGDPTHNNPSNLRYGTGSDNAQDRIKHGRQIDKRGERHHNAKLTAKQVQAIRASRDPLAVLAACFGVRRQQISRIRLGQRWRHTSRL